MDKVDCIVVGAGVVGLAVAARLAQSGLEVIVLEQHDCIGHETSSRNSEVIHAGIYYPSNSRKAKLCVAGKEKLYVHCEEYAVPYQRCGKLIVASRDDQVDTVRDYIRKGAENGVNDLVWLNAHEVAALEPEVKAVGGVLSPSTGIIDSHAFMLSLQGQLEQAGGIVALNTKVLNIEPHAQPIVHTEDFSMQCRWFINCAGLSAPSLAKGTPNAPQAYYAKGHYYAYAGAQPFGRLVYPTAEPGGLGVHVTLDLAGQVKFGPDVRWLDDIDYTFEEQYFDEFVAAISAYYPNLDATKLHPSYTGIRPKIAPAGQGFCDFRIDGPAAHGVPGWINLLGIESPGLTASLAIADDVAALTSQPV